MSTSAVVFSRAENKFEAGVVKNVFETSPMLTFMHYAKVPGLTVLAKLKDKINPAAFRSYNANFNTSNMKPLETRALQLFDFGQKFEPDPVLADVPAMEGSDHMGDIRKEASDAIALDIKGKIIGNAKGVAEPDGIYQWIDAYDSASNDVKLAFSTVGAKISANGSLQLITDMLNQLVMLVRPTFFMTNYKVISALNSVALNTATNGAFAAYWQLEDIMVNGRMQKMTTFLGIPFFDAGRDTQDEEVMGFTEDPGDGGSDTASILAVKSGPEDTLLYHFYPALLKYVEGEDKDSKFARVHAPHTVCVRNKRAAGRIFGILPE